MTEPLPKPHAPAPAEHGNNLQALREALFETLRQVKAGTLDLDRARAVNELGKTLVDSAKVEVEYLKTAGSGESKFLEGQGQGEREALPNGISSITRHRLRG